MPDVVMPRLSDSMEEGTVLKWLKSVGDEVAVGDELVEIETDKANMVYEAPDAGTLTEIVADEGATLGIGEVIAKVGDAGEVKKRPEKDESANGGAASGAGSETDIQKISTEKETATVSDPAPTTASQGSDGEGSGAQAAPPPSPAAVEVGRDGDGRVKASPIAKRIAKDRGVDLSSLDGSGPGGRIVKADVEKAVAGAGAAPAQAAAAPAAVAPAGPTAGAQEKPETAKGQVEVIELTKLQQTVARRMAESKATAPHFYLQAEIDMTSAVAGRKKLKEMAG